MISSLLIANRGEIARRIVWTARRLGVKTVAVYSDADAEAAHVREADVAVRLGPPPAAESYLNAEAILEAAAISGAEAIHPGYGFLSETADFAEACARAGLIFVGPPPAAMRLLGRKDRAKAAMIEAGVPVVPGYHGADQTDATLAAHAETIGWPLLIKAASGGGGKGMRAVHEAKDFPDALAAARREARAAFKDSDVILEKLIDRPRHIEVQVFGDAHGNVIHLGERDCSLQRRHQKVIEEAPAPGMTESVREAMCAAAVAAARRAGYVNAGTVEFIVDGSKGLRPDGFWFMEVNARLQVEHPVTEMVAGLDLVELQLRVASGERLPAQEQIRLQGHAVEARLYAEDPESGFLPSIGPLAIFDLPAFSEASGEALLRLDSGVEEGDAVRPHYDPMLAKAIAYAPTRAAAADALAQALARARIWPVRTNAGFLVRALRDPDFFAGRVDTGFIGARQETLCARAAPETAAALGGLVETLEARFAGAGAVDPWDARDGWRLNAPPRSASAFEIGERRWDASVSGEDASVRIAVGDAGAQPAELQRCDLRFGGGELEVVLGGRSHAVAFSRTPEALVLFLDGEAIELGPPRPGGHAAAETGDLIRAPMPGRVLSVRARAGQTVAAGDPVLVLEAMKMEHVLAAPRAGVLLAVDVAAGDQVAHAAVVARMEPRS